MGTNLVVEDHETQDFIRMCIIFFLGNHVNLLMESKLVPVIDDINDNIGY